MNDKSKSPLSPIIRGPASQNLQNVKRISPWIALIITPFFALLVFSLLAPLFAQDSVHLPWRENRREGILKKGYGISGADLDLISVLAYREKVANMPKNLKIKFYLPGQSPVHITIRELIYEKYYWLTGIKPKSPWRAGVMNNFSFPTGAVIAPAGVRLKNLGVLVRLSKKPGSKETVAPALLYYNSEPQKIDRYQFSFKSGKSAIIKYFAIYKNKKKVYKSAKNRRVEGGKTFTIPWKSKDAAAGQYKAILKGYVEDDNSSLKKTVKFYHQPVLR